MKNKNWVPYPRYLFRKELALSLIGKYVPKGSKFLEVGCGAGDFGMTLAGMGYTGVMIDFSEEAVCVTAENIRIADVQNVQVQKIDFFDFNSEHRFDLITMFEVLEHIEKDADTLQRVNGLLKEGGMFLFSVPSRKKLWGPYDIIAGHIRRYDKNDITQLTAETGFKTVELLSYGFPWLNILKIVRDKMAKKKLRTTTENDKVLSTKKSGLNLGAVKCRFLELFFSKWVLFLPMKISNLFNKMDLAEGYLCLAVKQTANR